MTGILNDNTTESTNNGSITNGGITVYKNLNIAGICT